MVEAHVEVDVAPLWPGPQPVEQRADAERHRERRRCIPEEIAAAGSSESPNILAQTTDLVRQLAHLVRQLAYLVPVDDSGALRTQAGRFRRRAAYP
jgi:hypothetical protein